MITIVLMVIYLPLTAKASTEQTELNEKILEEALKSYRNATIITPDNPLLRSSTQSFHSYVYRSAIIQVDRTSLSQGISMVITVEGSYQMHVCIFSRGSETNVIGNAKAAPAGQMSALYWSPEELGNVEKVDIFMTCYKNVTQYVYGSYTF